MRYWKANGRSAWILDDIGKKGCQITTSGFVVKDQSIDFARVLIYRESRGEQIAEASWLKKLTGRKLAGAAFDHEVDNVSGATLSVKVMQRMFAAALLRKRHQRIGMTAALFLIWLGSSGAILSRSDQFGFDAMRLHWDWSTCWPAFSPARPR